MYSHRKIEELIQIWKICFGDEESGIAFFFRYFGSEVRTLWQEADGRAVSMVNLLPAEVRLNGRTRQAYYIYAVGTLPEYRGRGYAGKLLLQAAKEAGLEGRPLFLVPEKEALWGFYEKLGFSPWARPGTEIRKRKVGRERTYARPAQSSLQNLDAGEYLVLRDRIFEGEGYLRLSGRGPAYALKLWMEEGGACACFRDGEKDYGLLYRLNGTEAEFLEVTARDPEEAAAAALGAARLLGAENFSLCQGRTVYARGPGISHSRNGYFNLAMD